MSRKDYVKFAELVRVGKARYGGTSPVMQWLETELADMFARDNPRFDRKRFAKACEAGNGK